MKKTISEIALEYGIDLTRVRDQQEQIDTITGKRVALDQATERDVPMPTAKNLHVTFRNLYSANEIKEAIRDLKLDILECGLKAQKTVVLQLQTAQTLLAAVEQLQRERELLAKTADGVLIHAEDLEVKG